MIHFIISNRRRRSCAAGGNPRPHKAKSIDRIDPACQSALDWGSDAISMVICGVHGAPINRACKRSIFARPYI